MPIHIAKPHGRCAVLALVALIPVFVDATQTVSAADLASRVQARYATIRDFTADFTQTETSPLLPRPRTEGGTVKIKKPSRMRWEYTAGERKQFVADGSRMYAYFPQDRYVEEMALPAGQHAPVSLAFLTGSVDLVREFTATVPAAHPAGEWRLVLTPKKSDPDLRMLTIEVDRASLAFRGFIVVDDQGATRHFRFTKLQENRGLADSVFVFQMPKNVELRRQ